MSSTVPQAVHEAVQTNQHVEQVQAIHEAPQPEIQRGTTTPSSKMFNIAVNFHSTGFTLFLDRPYVAAAGSTDIHSDSWCRTGACCHLSPDTHS